MPFIFYDFEAFAQLSALPEFNRHRLAHCHFIITFSILNYF